MFFFGKGEKMAEHANNRLATVELGLTMMFEQRHGVTRANIFLEPGQLAGAYSERMH